MKPTYRAHKIAAWTLIPLFMLFVVSGLDSIRRQFIPFQSRLWHVQYLFLPTHIAFVIHTSYVIHTRIVKKTKYKILAKLILPIYWLINLIIIIWFLLAFI